MNDIYLGNLLQSFCFKHYYRFKTWKHVNKLWLWKLFNNHKFHHFQITFFEYLEGGGRGKSFFCLFFWKLGVRYKLFFFLLRIVEECVVHFFLFMGGEYKSILFVFGGLRGGYKSFSSFFLIWRVGGKD